MWNMGEKPTETEKYYQVRTNEGNHSGKPVGQYDPKETYAGDFIGDPLLRNKDRHISPYAINLIISNLIFDAAAILSKDIGPLFKASIIGGSWIISMILYIRDRKSKNL